MKANILIIDDEESIRFSFHRFLAAEGHHVMTAGSYLEALARMDELVFDLVLADIVLDNGWGVDILQEVMRRKIKTRVIIMTAYPTTETIRASFRLQAMDYLIKPLRQGDLLHAVNKVLQQMEHMMLPPLTTCLERKIESCPTIGWMRNHSWDSNWKIY